MKGWVFRKQNLVKLLSFGWLCLVSACGGGGGDGGDSPSAATAADLGTMKGIIKDVDGNQSALKTWNIVHLERDTGIAHVVGIDEYGSFAIEGVDLSRPATLILLDSNYGFQSLLSEKAESEQVKQYFTAKSGRLPNLVQKGPVIRFADSAGISWTTDAVDMAPAPNDDPPRPKGVAALVAGGQAETSYIDIDGDGLPNSFDDNDDGAGGDALLDIFDPTPNGELGLDVIEKLGDSYFSRDIYYMAVQLVLEGTSTYYLKFTVKVREELENVELSVLSSAKTLEDALMMETDASGEEQYTKKWTDQKLLDDGKSEDGVKDDRVYAAKVKLSPTAKLQVPQAGQMFFVRVKQTRAGKTLTSDFPFRTPAYRPIPAPSPLAIVADGANNKFSTAVKPFGEDKYFWSFHLYDVGTAGKTTKIYASAQKLGGIDNVSFPSTLVSRSGSYKGEYLAVSQERIPGYPVWVVKSGKQDITPP